MVFLAALAVRVAYTLGIRGTPVTDVLLIDSATYDRFARLILAGRFHGEDVYSMNLLYPYLVAAVYAFGGGAFTVLIVQAVLGAFNAALVFVLARRLFSPPAAWVAGIAAAAYAPYVFYGGTLLTPTVIETATLASLVLLAGWRAAPAARALIGAGLCVGLASLGRGSALLAVPLAFAFFAVERRGWRPALRPWAVFAAAALALPVLATARNAMVEGRFVPISANYAAYYIGHHDGANGLYTMPAFVSTAAYEGEVTGARAALSRELGRPLTQAEASRELLRRGLTWSATHPGAEATLAARKLFLFWNRTESPTNLSFHFARDFSALLRALPLHLGIVAPLGLAGMIAARRRWREHLLLHLAVLAPLATCLLFFVSAEYRLPAVAAVIVFAAHALASAAAWLRTWAATGRGRPSADAWLALALLPLFAWACNLQTPLLRMQTLNRVAYYDHGVLYKERGDHDRAEAMLRRALAIDPRFAPAHLALADLEHRRGNGAEAARHLETARRLDPTIAAPGAARPEDAERVAAERLFQERRFDEALARFEALSERYAAIGDYAARVSVANNAGLCLYRLGRLDEAEQRLAALVAAAPGYVRAHTNLALVYEAQGRRAEALAAYRRALGLEPGNRRAQRAIERLGPP